MLSHLPSWGWIAFYVALSHMATMFLHLQITLSHFGMGTENPPGEEEFAAMGLRTTMDIECPRWMDWFHGGLQVSSRCALMHCEICDARHRF